MGTTLTACSTSGIAATGQGKAISVTGEMDEVISDYIIEYNKDKYYPTEKQFEAHKIYGAKEIGDLIEVYLYSVYMGFNQSTGEEEQAGGSFPVLIKFKKENDTYTVVNYQEPEDGAYYESSIKEMFPKKYARKALNDTGNIGHLEKEIKNNVREWLESSM
jgi:hypothetical protein